MGVGRVGHDHGVIAVGVGEEVEDPFLLHQPAGEVEVGLAVLDAVIAGLILPLELHLDVQALEDLIEDLGHRHLLEDPALRLAGQEPEFGDELEAVVGEDRVSAPLNDPVADAVQVAAIAARGQDLRRDLLAQELVEGDLGLIGGDRLELDLKQLGDRLGAGQADQQELVTAQRGRYREESVGLLICGRHRDGSAVDKDGTGQA